VVQVLSRSHGAGEMRWMWCHLLTNCAPEETLLSLNEDCLRRKQQQQPQQPEQTTGHNETSSSTLIAPPLDQQGIADEAANKQTSKAIISEEI